MTADPIRHRHRLTLGLDFIVCYILASFGRFAYIVFRIEIIIILNPHKFEHLGHIYHLAMIIIADAHIVDTRGGECGFFHMLRAIEKTDLDVIFLGDIFDLWVALPRYEKDIHKLFISWCNNQKNYRTVGFIEGNHEYFVANEKNSCFSWCSDAASFKDDYGNLFCHGDQINRKDRNYLRFRRISKNKISKTFWRLLPFGPHFGMLLKHALKKTNLEFRKHLPEDMIMEFAKSEFKVGTSKIFVAHFHQTYEYRYDQDKTLYVLPAWYNTEQITLYDREAENVNSLHWREILPNS
jgi:UDP-2,3-diacylglucosamine pyrophosphatase LpxH